MILGVATQVPGWPLALWMMCRFCILRAEEAGPKALDQLKCKTGLV